MFGYKNKNRIPLCVSRKVTETTLDLLLISEEEKQHYVWIKDFNRSMFNQNKHQHRQHFCRHCLQCFTSKEIFNKHTSNCIVVNGKQAVRMPKKGSSLQFKDFCKELPAPFNNNNNKQFSIPLRQIFTSKKWLHQSGAPFVIYADFEALTLKIDSCQPDDNKAYTKKYQKHTDCGYAYKLVCCYVNKFSKPIQLYRGEKLFINF